MKKKQEYHVVEYGLLGNRAFMEVGSRLIEVPLWVAAEWLPGGWKALLAKYGLSDSTYRPCEQTAFANIMQEARGIYTYYLKGYDKTLSRLHLDVIRIERQQMIEPQARFLLGKSKYEWIASKLNSRHNLNMTWMQIRALLEEAEEATLTALERQRNMQGVRLLKRLEGAVSQPTEMISLVS